MTAILRQRGYYAERAVLKRISELEREASLTDAQRAAVWRDALRESPELRHWMGEVLTAAWLERLRAGKEIVP